MPRLYLARRIFNCLIVPACRLRCSDSTAYDASLTAWRCQVSKRTRSAPAVAASRHCQRTVRLVGTGCRSQALPAGTASSPHAPYQRAALPSGIPTCGISGDRPLAALRAGSGGVCGATFCHCGCVLGAAILGLCRCGCDRPVRRSGAAHRPLVVRPWVDHASFLRPVFAASDCSACQYQLCARSEHLLSVDP